MLVTVPAPVPELGLRIAPEERAGQRPLQRVEHDDRARATGQLEPARLGGGERVGEAHGQPAERAVGHARGLEGDDAVGAQEVLGLLAQDEALQRAGQQQHGDVAVFEAQSPAG